MLPQRDHAFDLVEGKDSQKNRPPGYSGLIKTSEKYYRARILNAGAVLPVAFSHVSEPVQAPLSWNQKGLVKSLLESIQSITALEFGSVSHKKYVVPFTNFTLAWYLTTLTVG